MQQDRTLFGETESRMELLISPGTWFESSVVWADEEHGGRCAEQGSRVRFATKRETLFEETGVA